MIIIGKIVCEKESFVLVKKLVQKLLVVQSWTEGEQGQRCHSSLKEKSLICSISHKPCGRWQSPFLSFFCQTSKYFEELPLFNETGLRSYILTYLQTENPLDLVLNEPIIWWKLEHGVVKKQKHDLIRL